MRGRQVLIQGEFLLLQRVVLAIDDNKLIAKQAFLFEMFRYVPVECDREIDATGFQLL